VGGAIGFVGDGGDGDGDNAVGAMRMTLSESEGAVTNSKRDGVSLIFCWNRLFKSVHYKSYVSCFVSRRKRGGGRERTYTPDVISEAIDSVRSEHEPHFKRPESSTKSEMPISVVNN
jgi:hypothetical protein